MVRTMMTPKRRKEKLEELFTLHGEALRQSVGRCESRRTKIAIKVLDRAEEIYGQIRTLVSEGQYPPSVNSRIAALHKDQSRFTQALQAAIRGRAVRKAKTVLRWMVTANSELMDLVVK